MGNQLSIYDMPDQRTDEELKALIANHRKEEREWLEFAEQFDKPNKTSQDDYEAFLDRARDHRMAARLLEDQLTTPKQ